MAVKDRANGLFVRAQSLVDRVVAPDTRSQFYSNVSKFSHEKPILASFLFIQFLFCATPLIAFISFTIGIFLLPLIAAILFSLFWTGVALLVLLPILFVTFSFGVGVWIWGVSSFLIARWVYNVMPVRVKGSTQLGLPNGKKAVITKGDWNGEVKAEVRDEF